MAVDMSGYAHEGDKTHTFRMLVYCSFHSHKVACIAQISDELASAYSGVEHLTLSYEASPQWPIDPDIVQWRNLLKLFSNVKTLFVDRGFTHELSRSLLLDSGAPPSLLPQLKELQVSARGKASAAFTAFIGFREKAGQPVNLVSR
jgi:hypothetical protein